MQNCYASRLQEVTDTYLEHKSGQMREYPVNSANAICGTRIAPDDGNTQWEFLMDKAPLRITGGVHPPNPEGGKERGKSHEKGGKLAMKRISIFLFLSVLSHLLVAVTASADPRMETNKNFCHFILDPLNTDNEVFAAGCDSVITVVEKTTNADNALEQCEEDNYVANGHALVLKQA